MDEWMRGGVFPNLKQGLILIEKVRVQRKLNRGNLRLGVVMSIDVNVIVRVDKG
jgi:hypothetical protein